MPSLPLRYDSTCTKIDLSVLNLNQIQKEREDAFDVARRMKADTQQILLTVGTPQATQALLDFRTTTYAPHFDTSSQQQENHRTPRLANLSNAIEEYVSVYSYHHFLLTGQLLDPSDIPGVTDEEYLAGACMGLMFHLKSYGLGRATLRDIDSVSCAKNIVEQLLQYLLEFDFRNGPLRRKYDGCKYTLKSLETFLYELAVTSSDPSSLPDTKKQKTTTTLLPDQTLQELRVRMQERDEWREALIKNCRDAQKMAKQSIFALHRHDKEKANALLTNCQDCIVNVLLPTIEKEPSLRSGSFANVMEEFVEARLFYAWLHHGDSVGTTILTVNDFATIDNLSLQPEDYLGGICDLTGEIGRFAVHCGTTREVDKVRLCLSTNMGILSALHSLERLPKTIEKKLNTVQTSVQKLERMLYELMLSEAAGGRNIIVRNDDNDTNE